jgi:nitrogen fixation protein NifB
VGLLEEDRTDELRGCLSACSKLPQPAEVVRPYVAVVTLEGVLVNQHLGEAIRFQIWGEDGKGCYRCIEERKAPPPGGGSQRWFNISRILADCRAILVNDLGDSPKEMLKKRGIQPITMTGFIERGLEAVYTGKGVNSLQGRMRKCSTKGACVGGGNGCG